MQMLDNLKVGQRIIALIVVMVIAMVGIGYLGYYYQKKANEDMTSMYKDRLLPVKWLNQSRANTLENDKLISQLLIVNDPIKQNEIFKAINRNAEENNRLLAEYEETKLDPFEVETLPKLKKEQGEFRGAVATVIQLIKSGKTSEAAAFYNANLNAGAEYLEKITALAEYNAKVADEINTQNDKDFALATKMTFGITLVIIAMAVAVGLIIGRSITGPLNIMVASIAKDANGQIAIRQTNIATQDEIGYLAQSLNGLVMQVRDFVTTAAEASEKVAASSEELTASAQQSAAAANQVATAVTRVAQGAESQLNLVNETAAIAEQISASVQQTAANANNVADMAAKTGEATKDGRAAVDKAVEQMGNIGRGSDSVQEAVEKLAASSQQIGQIVEVISGIAGQTNLLALNAAIEAARAGEQGRGFAVVAEEVRKLAEQSQEAAKEITAVINDNSLSIDNAVTAMRAGAEDVKIGVEVVNNAGQAFAVIDEHINQMAGQVKEISAATQQIASGGQQIVSAVHNIERTSKDTASQTQTVSATTEEQSASMEEIAASSQTLARMAEELQNAVRAFKM